MTIARRIAFGFTAPLAVLVLIAALAYWSTLQLIDSGKWVTHTHAVLTNLEALLSTMKDAETGQRGFLLTEDSSYLAPYNSAVANWENLFNKLKDLTKDNLDQQGRLEELRPLLAAKFEELKETIDLRRKHKGAKGLEVALRIVKSDRGKDVMDKARALIADMKREEADLLKRRDAEAARNIRLTHLTIGVGTLLSILFVSLVGFFLVRATTQPIRAAINQLASSSEELLAGTTQQATGSRQQAAAVTETVATVDEVTQIADQSAQRARGLSEAVQRTTEIGRTGRKVVEESIAALDRVREQVESTAENILALAEQAQAIGEIIAAVNDVAEQTNLLALNAAIEASRAGEHGKGFAVVASEVKALADQSKKATAQVRQILGEIQKATNGAVLSMEDVTKGVASAGRVAGQSGDAIKALMETLGETAQAMLQIVASAGQQAQGMAQIHQAMKNIEQATRQNLAATQQTEQAAKNLNNLGGEFAQFIGTAQRG